jgi:hypothetical protein
MATNPAIWTEAFHRASRESIGIALRVSNPQRSMYLLHEHRPADPAFRDYTIARTPIPDLIFLIRPGVTLDDPEVMSNLFHGGPDLD